MGRRPRLDPEGGWHHVMNRGAGRRDVFRSAGDGQHFLRLVGEGCELSKVEVHAYCLMGNHYHLLLHCPSGGLSDFMHRLGSMYARYVNWRIESDGPMFRGRFHSLVVDSSEYLVCAARYIHRNPTERRPVVPLDRYPWSSYGAYVGARTVPVWLSTARLLKLHGGAVRLRSFVEGDDESASTTSIDWAIDTALAELCDPGTMTPHVRRAVAVAMLTRTTHSPVESLLERALQFPSDDARRMAMSRARQRAVNDPSVAAIADRALRLVA